MSVGSGAGVDKDCFGRLALGTPFIVVLFSVELFLIRERLLCVQSHRTVVPPILGVKLVELSSPLR